MSTQMISDKMRSDTIAIRQKKYNVYSGKLSLSLSVGSMVVGNLQFIRIIVMVAVVLCNQKINAQLKDRKNECNNYFPWKAKWCTQLQKKREHFKIEIFSWNRLKYKRSALDTLNMSKNCASR